MKYPIGVKDFELIVKGGYVYVDKTQLVYDLVHNGMIYQSGYLTIKGRNMNLDSYLLDFPNDEVRNGFLIIAAANYLKPSEPTETFILQVMNAMGIGDCNQFEKLLTSFFASIPYTQRRKKDEREKERYFQYTSTSFCA